MSTLMSKDLHINRSSTRLHAPPGGKSNLSLSDGTSSFNQFDRSPLPAKNNYSSYQSTNNSMSNSSAISAYPTSYSPSVNNAPNRSIPSSSSSSSASTMMDPKLQQYMQTLSAEEKKIFESLVNEEMDKLSSDFKSSSIDYSPPSNCNQQYSPPQTQYPSSMSSSMSSYQTSAPPAVYDERVSQHSQKQIKQQNQGGSGSGNYSSNYSDSNDNSIMNIGARKPSSSGISGGRISSFSSGSGSASSDEYVRKRLAQETYSKQLAEDTNSKASSNNNNNNSRFGNRPSSSRELQQRLVESNYVSPRSDLFSGLTGSNKNKMSQQEYAQALQQDQYRNSTIEPPRRTPLKKPNSQSGGYDNDNNAYSNNYGGGSGHGGSSGGGSSSGIAGMLSPTGNTGGGRPSAGFADTANQRDKQQKYAYDLAMDVQRKKEIQQDKERNQYTPNAKNNANNNNNNNNNNYPPVASANNYYEPSNTNSYNGGNAQYNDTTAPSFNYGGGGDDRVKEYSAYNIPGLAPAAPYNNGPYAGGGGSGNNDYDYVAHSPIYTSKAKAGGGNMPMTDSIDYQLNSSYNNSRGGGGGANIQSNNNNNNNNTGSGMSYYAVGNTNNNSGGGGNSSSSNPIRSVSVGRGRSSGGGQSSIQLY